MQVHTMAIDDHAANLNAFFSSTGSRSLSDDLFTTEGADESWTFFSSTLEVFTSTIGFF